MLFNYFLPFLATSATVFGSAIPDHTLQKRTATWVYDSKVSTADRAKIEQAYKDILTLAGAAADISYESSDVSNVYHKYYPTGYEERIKAMWTSMAGRTQTWGGQTRGAPNWSGVTIKVNNNALSASQFTEQANAVSTSANTCVITLQKQAIDLGSLSEVDTSKLKPYASSHMETIASVLIHELLHCPFIYRDTFNISPTGAYLSDYIDDQPSPNKVLYTGKSYGSYGAQQLKKEAPLHAFINNDNHMFFAVEAYWHRKTGTVYRSITRTEFAADCPLQMLANGCTIL